MTRTKDAEIAHLRQLRAAVIGVRDRSIAQADKLRAAIGSTGPRPTARDKPLTDKALLGLAKKDETIAKESERTIATLDRKIAALGG